MSDTTEKPDLPSRVLGEQFHLELPSLPHWIEPAAEFLRERMVLAGACHAARAGKAMIALHEALANSIIHGNLGISSELKERGDDAFARALAERAADPERAGRRVDVQVAYDGTWYRWILTDRGEGFDVPLVLARCLSEDPEIQLASGRGILMMFSLLDEIRYEDGGRRVILGLQRASGAEKRSQPRFPLQQALRVTPIREDGTVDWKAAYAAVSRDLSEGGVGLLQANLAHSGRVLIGLEREGRIVQVPAEVRHCRDVGEGLVELGCRFHLAVPSAAETLEAAAEEREVHEVLDDFLEKHRNPLLPPHDRRHDPRVVFNERVDLHVGQGEPIPAYARDLSRSGISFIITAPVPDEFVIALPSRGAAASLRLRCGLIRCVRIEKGFYDVGARFLRLEERRA